MALEQQGDLVLDARCCGKDDLFAAGDLEVEAGETDPVSPISTSRKRTAPSAGACPLPPLRSCGIAKTCDSSSALATRS
jgi:hypothetical protein